MKLRLTVLFYSERSLQKEKKEKLIHGDDYELPLNEFSKRICYFYNVDAIYSCELDENYSCLVSGGQVFMVCMSIDKLEKRVDKAKLESLLSYSIQ